MNKDILKLRILTRFLDQDAEAVTVTALSEQLGQSKAYISKLMHELENNALIDMSDNRRPCLTARGLAQAKAYDEKVQVNLHHLLYEGVDYENAVQDAFIMAFYCSDATNHARLQTDRLFRAKLAVRDKPRITGHELCRNLADGEYNVPFYIYKAKGRGKSPDILSMANAGFEQPARLIVENGIGTFYMTGKPMIAKSRVSGLEMKGKVESVKYMEGKMYVPCSREGDVFSFPAFRIRFQNILFDNRQVLHGSVRLSMRCDVGVAHMPESVAVVVFIL